jgi:uncharacterized OsmC-like protein
MGTSTVPRREAAAYRRSRALGDEGGRPSRRTIILRRRANPPETVTTTFKEHHVPVTDRDAGIQLVRLSATIRAVNSGGRSPFRARRRSIGGTRTRPTGREFHGSGREDPWRTDAFVDHDERAVRLGPDAVRDAAEYVLHALAGCLTSAIVYHAEARGIGIDSLDCTVEGDLDLRGFLDLDDARPRFENLRAAFRISGDVDDDQLADLPDLSRSSPVRDIVANPILVTIEVVPA